MISNPIEEEAIKREVLNALPVGSSLAAVENYFTKRGHDFSFDAEQKMAGGFVKMERENEYVVFLFLLDDTLAVKSTKTMAAYVVPEGQPPP